MAETVELGVINGLRVVEARYDASWSEATLQNELLPRWRRQKPGWFDQGSSGLTGNKGLFAQTCLAYLLSEPPHGYRSTTFYSLAKDSTEIRSKYATPKELAMRQDFIKACIGDTPFFALREALNAAHLGKFAGEPDLFCWHPTKGHWFFAEAKDHNTNDGLRYNQVRWMFVAKSVLGEQADFRLYVVRPDS